MANITEILGTDSVSSSRPTINSNFELLNDELATITALLDPTTATLSSVTSITAQTLTLTNGGTSIVLNPSSGATFGEDATFSRAIIASGKIIKNGTVGSVAAGSTDVAPASLVGSTYIMGSTVTSLAIPAGDEGQEITVISTAASALSITAQTGAELAATSISLDGLNSTVTLRCFSTKWFVISSHNTTIS